MMQKKKKLFTPVHYTLWGPNILCAHMHQQAHAHTPQLHLLSFSLTRHLQWNMDNFLPVTALLFTIRAAVGAAEQKVDKIKTGSLEAAFLLAD